jgi:hypothetical protein
MLAAHAGAATVVSAISAIPLVLTRWSSPAVTLTAPL